MKKFLFCLLFFLSSVALFAQNNVNSISSSEELFYYENNSNEPHYLIAVTGSLLPSALFYSWNNFVLQAGWAKMDDEDREAFYNRDLKYDDDWVSTNFVGHPYQGSLYYLSGRSANLNMFESFCISIFGSYMWEYCCEANRPSINDMVYTTIGAFALGEMLNKLSHQADENNYIFHYMINPIQMYSDLFLGKRPVKNDNCIESLDLWFGLSSSIGLGGPLSSEYDSIIEKYPFMAKTGINVLYNDPYGHISKEPYDQFELSIFMGIGPGNDVVHEKPLENQYAYNTSLFSNGVLKSFAKDVNDNNEISYGFSMLYDYTWNSFYEFTSLAPALFYNQRIKNFDSYFGYQLHLGFNILGITEFNYYRRQQIELPSGNMRSYNYVFGLELYAKAQYEFKNHKLTFNSHSFASDNFYDSENGNYTGWSFYALDQLSYEYMLSKNVCLGLQDNFYVNYSFYRSLPNYFSLQNEVDLYAKWYFK